MKEIISVNVGGAGIQVASPVWEMFCHEHGVQLDGSLQTTEP